jgi:ElaB/YqjD/DUF883 family membrane-anchored ribosome-binding protein
MDIKGPVQDTTSLAKNNIDEAAASLQSIADRTTGQVEAVGENMRDAIDKSLTEQPYTTLLMAVGVGFVLGAIWKA